MIEASLLRFLTLLAVSSAIHSSESSSSSTRDLDPSDVFRGMVNIFGLTASKEARIRVLALPVRAEEGSSLLLANDPAKDESPTASDFLDDFVAPKLRVSRSKSNDPARALTPIVGSVGGCAARSQTSRGAGGGGCGAPCPLGGEKFDLTGVPICEGCFW